MPLYDSIQMEIFSQRLLSITEEMGAQLVRSSFSPNIKERRDCSVALFDASGQVIAQAALDTIIRMLNSKFCERRIIVRKRLRTQWGVFILCRGFRKAMKLQLKGKTPH